jgi:hypothetical protein
MNTRLLSKRIQSVLFIIIAVSFFMNSFHCNDSLNSFECDICTCSGCEKLVVLVKTAGVNIQHNESRLLIPALNPLKNTFSKDIEHPPRFV